MADQRLMRPAKTTERAGANFQTRLTPPAAPPADTRREPLNIETLLARMQDMPALPTVVLRVLRLSRDERGSARAMANMIAQDVTLALRVLKLANSAYYGLPRSVGTLTDAVTLLGNHSIRHLALVASTHDTLRQELRGYGIGTGELWRHSLACALAAQILAEAVGYGEPEEAFVAGLLHDVGKVVLNKPMQAAQEQANKAGEAELSLREWEQKALGIDHAEVGGRVALRWNLPNTLAQAIAWHHAPLESSSGPLPILVHTANALCWQIGCGTGPDQARTDISPSILDALRMNDARLTRARTRLESALAEAQSLLAMEPLE